MNGLFVGSFNPFHIGHEKIVRTALKFCDQVYTCVAVNPEKTDSQVFDIRLKWMKESLQDLISAGRVVLCSTSGLVADFCSENNIGLIIKGCRNPSDFERERTQANINKVLNPSVDTILIPSSPTYENISSTLVRTLVQFGKPITGLVNQNIEDEVVEHFKKLNR